MDISVVFSLVLYIAIILLFFASSIIDFKTLILPNETTVGLFVCSVAFLCVNFSRELIIPLIVTYSIVIGLGLLSYFKDPEQEKIGFGDIKLVFALVPIILISDYILIAFSFCIVSMICSIILLIMKKREMAMGQLICFSVFAGLSNFVFDNVFNIRLELYQLIILMVCVIIIFFVCSFAVDSVLKDEMVEQKIGTNEESLTKEGGV